MRKPVLWHIPVSHYNEKARWALDWKRIEHELRAPPPGVHMGFALALTRGSSNTFPVLQIEGRTIGDSAAIIAALDELHPERPLIPSDPGERRRALEIERFFDDELGPYARHLAMHAMRGDREAREAFVAKSMPDPVAGIAAVRRGAGSFANVFFKARYGVDADSDAANALAKVHAAYDRLEAELEAGDGSHLVGDDFTVADLAAASLFVPLVAPQEGPDLPPPPARLAEIRKSMSERRGTLWVRETFHRYRHPAVTAGA